MNNEKTIEKIIKINGKEYLEKHYTNTEFGIDVISYSEANGDQLSKSFGGPTSIHYDPKTGQKKKEYYIYSDTDEYAVTTYYKNNKKIIERYNMQGARNNGAKFDIKEPTKIEYYIGNKEVLFRYNKRVIGVDESDEEKEINKKLEDTAEKYNISPINIKIKLEEKFLSDLEEY